MSQLLKATRKVRLPKQVTSRTPRIPAFVEAEEWSKDTATRFAVELAISEAGTPEGSQKVAAYLKTLPFPHYEADAETPRVFVRIDADGTRTRGRFINRQFESVP